MCILYRLDTKGRVLKLDSSNRTSKSKARCTNPLMSLVWVMLLLTPVSRPRSRRVTVLDLGRTLKAFPDHDWPKKCGLKISF